MVFSFKRITSSGLFIPEIDGLRFVAIACVVLTHLRGFINAKYVFNSEDNSNYLFLTEFLSHGYLGVPLFFAISGFILGMPFAKYHLLNGDKINIKKYFLRRLTRLEPPYILVMTALLFSLVYIVKKMPLDFGIKSYLASIFYSHNMLFPGVLPRLNGVAWSLEVEVQFYIIAPLMAFIFSLKSTYFRRFLIIIIAFSFILINNFDLVHFKFISLLNFIQYFLIGFLLADLYVTKSILLPKTKYDLFIGFFLSSIIWFFDEPSKAHFYNFILEVIQNVSIFFLYYFILIHKIFKFLSLKIITNIGGMCYSIYLLHYPIISITGNYIVKLKIFKSDFLNISVYSILLTALVMLVSSIFFLLIEKPCMDKDWYLKIFKRGASAPS